MTETTAPQMSDDAGQVDYAAASRAALVEALVAAGPGAPTLCEGWQTEHLAAHIVLRERSPLAAGLLLPPAADALERKTLELGNAHATEASYARLVEQVEQGPLGDAPARRGLRSRVRAAAARLRRTAPATTVAAHIQLLEFFVHTEDVRRAQETWAPRILTDDYADTLFTHLKSRARLLYHGEDTGVRLERRARGGSVTDNTVVTVKKPGKDERVLSVAGPA
ncbi:MAG: maleylpyruvate isomerase family mycothiol-dependent enzyme, partial [Micrococcus sp.]|nr:maleylpyruvate isomerase family mycothiol-dependent enzyme [Micrococcus sp.]